MVNITDYCTANGYPAIDLTKSPDAWHKLEDDSFKGSYIFKLINFGSKEILVLTVHNFRSGETQTERFGAEELTRGETLKLSKVIKEQEEAAQKEKERQHEQCKKYANEQFSKFTEVNISSNPYLQRKIPASLSCGFPVYQRNNLVGGVDLVCPIVDWSGSLWNYQTISERGEKQILIGGKYKGLFIPIIPRGKSVSDLKDFNRIYVVEGFSTGLSVFMALDEKFPVLCAISSSNIYNVCSELRVQYGKTPYIICADNDCWKRDHENTGKVTAEDTVSRIDGGTYVCPDFSGCSETELAQKPTDYNDLHNLRGIDEVRRQLGQVVLNRPRVIYPLGYNQKNYYFTTSKVPQIQAISEFSEVDLLKLAPHSYWVQKYPSPKGGIDMPRVRSELIDTCQSVGLFEASRLRGRGVYRDDGKLVHHVGDKIRFIESGEERDLADMRSNFYYDPKPAWHYPRKTPPKSLISDIHEALTRFSWSHPFEAKLCLGWLLTSPLAGCLPWRSHLAITAEAGSGKTTLLQALNSMLAGWLPLKSEGITEAGLRQSLGTDAVPVILDEQDTNSLDAKAFDKIMSLFRMASSEGEVRRGTISGKSLKFNACFSGCIAGINLPNMKHADLTRFCIIDLDPNRKTGSWADMQKQIEVLFKRETSEELLEWTLVNADNVTNTITKITPLVEVMSDARTAQQYANFLGAVSYALGIEIGTLVDELKSYWKEKTEASATEYVKDSDQCLAHLLNLSAAVDSDRRSHSLGKVLEETNEPTEIIAQFDMKVVDKNRLFIPNTHPILAKHFSGTPWPNWNKAIKRIKGSEPKIIWMNGKSVRGLTVEVKLPEVKF